MSNEKEEIINDAKIALALIENAFFHSRDNREELTELGFIKSTLTDKGKSFLKVALSELIKMAEKE